MLTELNIHNFAIIESLHLPPPSGLIAITGETGAGKSIIIEAIKLLMGERSIQDQIRTGASKAEISAVFDLEFLPDASNWLRESDLYIGNECIIRRIIKKDGRSKSYINGYPCPVAHLKTLGLKLINLLGQHQQQHLLHSETLLNSVDQYADCQTLAAQTLTAWRLWQASLIQARQLQEACRLQAQRQELIRYQLEELQALELKENTFEQLAQQYQALSHAEHNLAALQQAQLLLDNDSKTSILVLAAHCLHQLESITPQTAPIHETIQFLKEISIYADEAISNLKIASDLIDLDPALLAEIGKRLDHLNHIAQKHRTDPNELPALEISLRQECENFSENTQSLEAIQEKCRLLEQEFHRLADKLAKQRAHAAPRLAAQLKASLKRLGIPDFSCEFTFSSNPFEGCDLLMSTHSKQPLLPMRKIASGGELSRIALSLNVICNQMEDKKVLIFDEIDTGVGGKIAENIASMLAQLGEHHQVLCITHLAQVAAKARHHFMVEKQRDENALYSNIKELSQEMKPAEIARMLGGEAVAEESLIYARAILNSNYADSCPA